LGGRLGSIFGFHFEFLKPRRYRLHVLGGRGVGLRLVETTSLKALRAGGPSGRICHVNPVKSQKQIEHCKAQAHTGSELQSAV